MLFKNITLLDEDLIPRDHQYLGTEGRFITYIGSVPPPDEARFGRVYNGQNKLLIPGFYNAHSHIPMHLLRGYAENLMLSQWLNTRIFPFENQLTPDDIYWSGLAGIAEMLRFGIVGTTDMYMGGDRYAQAFVDGGVKVNLGCGCTWFEDASYYDLPNYTETLHLLDTFHGRDDGRIRIEFSLHAEYTSFERIAREIAEASQKHHSSMHVHVSETKNEVDVCRIRHQGRSPVRYFYDNGLFDVPTVAAHCVHIDDDDIALLKEKNVTVATCPTSNLKLASGVCPAGKLLKAGVNLALGTDGVSSNNNLNMLEEIKIFALLHKGISGDPTLITPTEAVHAATRAGALAQGRSDCGLLKKGLRADLAALNTDHIYMQPVHNILNNLVYSSVGSDVCLTMVDGRVLYENGEYPQLDVEKIIYETEKSRVRIVSELAAKDEKS